MASSVEQVEKMNEEESHPQGADAEAREKRAVKKEELVVLTSGAKEKLDKTIAGMKGAAHVMAHGFSKGARDDATAKTIEEKDKIGYKQANVRMAAHQQVVQEKAIAAGVGTPQQLGDHGSPADVDSPMPGAVQPNTTGPSPARPAVSAQEIEEESPSSSSSDSSSRGRAQIPPDSEEYRSG